MQKAVIVRALMEGESGICWSREVDAPSGSGALKQLLADGWRITQSCPMPSELDCCCLVVLEKPDETHPPLDVPLSRLNSLLDPSAGPAYSAPTPADLPTALLTPR